MLMKTTVAHPPSSTGTSGITLDSLRVSYHGNVVLKPLTLTIEPGEVLALIGPSGSGKTTVLRAIAGFVQPAGGRILLGDTDVTHLPPYQRGLGMVVQNYALFPHMKVEDNVAFGLTLADKIGIMKDGSLIAHGETHQLYHYPPNRFTAEFLGRANILQATALKDTAGPGLVSVSCGGGLITAFSRGGQHGNNKLLCIRPQHMSLAPRTATSNRLNATLQSVHWQGDLTHLLCEVAGEAVRIVMTHVDPLPRAGDRLALYFEPNDAVLIEVS